MLFRQFQIYTILLLVSLNFGTSRLFGQENQIEKDIQFTWNFVVAPSGIPGTVVQKVSKDTILHSGDNFKLFFNFQKSVFAYVIHKSPQNELTLLYPKSKNNEHPITGKNIFIPEGNEWYKLDSNIGKETFHILVSKTRLDRLEDLLREYYEHENGQMKELVDAISEEIKEIKKKHRSFTQQPEKPVSIAGTVRGMADKKNDKSSIDISTSADEVVGNTLFSKTITIDHK